MRLRLRTSGAGKWVDSGGYQSKFGVSLPELLELVEELKAGDCVQRLVLLHFHLGSQITNITQLKQAARELAQTYAELVLSGLSIRYIDVGGGLGVNYTGAFEDGSINYSLQEYANAVVSVICDVCNDRGVPHPTLMSESGRAMAAHHSVLVVETLGAFRKDRAGDDPQIPGDAHRVLRQFGELLDWLRQEQQDAKDVNALVEAYHDVIALHEEAHTLFTMGYLPLEQNALVERLYWSSCANILRSLNQAGNEPMPPEFDKLQELMVDQYLVDFSVFQSLLDHWAIQQPFPIVPLDRLDERPTRRAILVDLTCDSDGRVTEYVSSNDDRKFLELHELDPGEHYYLGIFLTGAYQDIMGDDHNLLGRVSEAHIYADAEEKGNFWIEKLIPGARVGDMLAKVQYFTEDLQRRMQKIVKQKIESGAIRPSRGIEVLEQYKDMFEQETYLINDRASGGETR